MLTFAGVEIDALARMVCGVEGFKGLTTFTGVFCETGLLLGGDNFCRTGVDSLEALMDERELDNFFKDEKLIGVFDLFRDLLATWLSF